MVKNLLLLVSFAVICLGASSASAGGFWSFWNSFHDSSFNGDDGPCNPIPEPSGALLFTAGGLVFAATKRHESRK